MTTPISLTDEQYATVLAAAATIIPAERDAFLRALADELGRHPVVGEGLLHRLCADLQRRFVVEARAAAETSKGPEHRGPRLSPERAPVSAR